MAQLKVMDPVAQLASELGQFAPCGRTAAVDRTAASGALLEP